MNVRAVFWDIVPSVTIAILVVMGVALIPASIGIFAWAEARAKRLGLLKRSG